MGTFRQTRPCRQPGQSLWHGCKQGLSLCCRDEDLEEEEEATGEEDLEEEGEADEWRRLRAKQKVKKDVCRCACMYVCMHAHVYLYVCAWV